MILFWALAAVLLLAAAGALWSWEQDKAAEGRRENVEPMTGCDIQSGWS